MDGWMDGWMDGCVGGVDGWMDAWTDGWMDGWMMDGSGVTLHVKLYRVSKWFLSSFKHLLSSHIGFRKSLGH